MVLVPAVPQKEVCRGVLEVMVHLLQSCTPGQKQNIKQHNNSWIQVCRRKRLLQALDLTEEQGAMESLRHLNCTDHV